MAEIIKFVYIMILCVSLLLIEVAGEECVTDADCDKLYPDIRKPLMCSIGECYSLYKGKFSLSIISKTSFSLMVYNVVTLVICLRLAYISLLLKFL
uniref:Nodule-specific cysteine-rich peptide 332 n=1 Tax=Medicago truncatula TaxID=3880 RepID=A7KHG2_MEDTR|nr:nodule-specific cysteine-rich peptide 332 [Medicago truncatula]